MFDMASRILLKEDEDAANVIHKSMLGCGVKFVLGSKVVAVEPMNGSWIKLKTANGQTYECSHLLIATGRKPNVCNLSLDAAKVEHDEVNGIKVNDFLQTSNANIYAAD